MLSTALHAAALAASFWATLEAKPDAPAIVAERVAAVNVGAFHSAPVPQRQPASKARQGFQVLEAPHEVPTTLSLASLQAPATIPEDFTGYGAADGKAVGIAVAPEVTVARGDEPIEGAFADQMPYMLPGQMGPTYPPLLRDRGPDGLVVVRFVIDTLGRVEPPSLDVVQSSHPLFLASVRTALDRLRFLPARFSGRRVRARMEQRFEFHLAGH